MVWQVHCIDVCVDIGVGKGRGNGPPIDQLRMRRVRLIGIFIDDSLHLRRKLFSTIVKNSFNNVRPHQEVNQVKVSQKAKVMRHIAIVLS